MDCHHRHLRKMFSKAEVTQKADVQRLSVGEGVVLPEQQVWRSSLDQEDPEHIKEEREELWISQEGAQLQEVQEEEEEDDDDDDDYDDDDVIKFLVTHVPVKSEDIEEKPQSSQLHRSQTEEDTGAEPRTSSSAEHMKRVLIGEDRGGPEPNTNSDSDGHDMALNFSETETDNSDDWKETRKPQSGLNSLINNEGRDSELCNVAEKPFSCSQCGKQFGHRGHLNVHMSIHTEVKPFSCSQCCQTFKQKGSLNKHMKIHTGEKPFSCSECGKRFWSKWDLKSHMRLHTGEKPFRCSICGKRFTHVSTLTKHTRCHTGEKPYSCPVCEKHFRQSGQIEPHMRVHTGERPYHCLVCNKSFPLKTALTRHMTVHTGEKRFQCRVCEKNYSTNSYLKRHKCVEGAH